MKKYELTDETVTHNGRTLHRIRALVTIPGTVLGGELGGWIESEDNLSQKGDCWVAGNAVVYGDARVYENARVDGNAEVFDRAKIYGYAKVFDSAQVSGNARVYGKAIVRGSSRIREYASVFDDADVYGTAWLHGNAMVFGFAMVFGDADVSENAKVSGYARVYGSAAVLGNADVWGGALVSGNALLRDGHLTEPLDYVCIGPAGSRMEFTTLNKTTGTVCTGCFSGTLDEFEAAVKKTYGDNGYGAAYKAVIACFKALAAK